MNKPIILGGLAVLWILLVVSVQVYAEDITVCRDLNESVTYNLISSIGTTATQCFNMTTDNVVLDCNGNDINQITSPYVGDWAINTIGHENITVQNCQTHNWDTSTILNNSNNVFLNNVSLLGQVGDYELYMNNSKNVNITNSTIVENLFQPLILLDSNNENITIENNTIGNGENAPIGIQINDHNNKNILIKNNIMTGTGDQSILSTNTTQLKIENNVITLSRIELEYTNNAIIENNTINDSAVQGTLGLYGSNNNTVKNNIIKATPCGECAAPVSLFIDTSSSDNTIFNNLINGTLAISDVTWNNFNTTKQAGQRITGVSCFNLIGGNYYAQSDNSGYSQTCAVNSQGFCQDPFNINEFSSNVFDYLPLGTINTQNITVSICGQEVCGVVSNNTILNFSFYDEKNPIIQTSNNSMEMDLLVYNSTGQFLNEYSLAMNDTTGFAICVNPSDSVITANATIIYRSQGFWQRTYYLINSLFNGLSPQAINLYVLNNTIDGLTRVYVESSVGSPLEGAYVKIERYYPQFADTGFYKTVAIVKTADITGDAFTFLEYTNAFYKFVIQNDNTVLKAFSNKQVEKASNVDVYATVALRVSNDIGEYFKYLLGTLVQYQCTPNNETAVVSCVVEDTSGLMANANLTVKKLVSYSTMDVCSAIATSSGETMLCDISSSGDGSYVYQLTVTTSNQNTYIITSDPFHIGSTQDFGVDALPIMLIIFMIFTAVGIANYKVGLVLQITAVIITALMTGISIELGIGIISLVFLYGVFIMKSR